MYLNADRETHARITDYFIVSQILNYIRLSGLRFNKFSVYCCFIVFLQRSYKTFIPAFWSRCGLWQKTQKWKKNITCVIKFSIKEARNKTRIDSIHYQWQQTRKGMHAVTICWSEEKPTAIQPEDRPLSSISNSYSVCSGVFLYV